MPGSLAALLCLGLCLSQSVRAQKQLIPKPTLWAMPSTVIPWGKTVTIRCHGSHDTQKFILEKEGTTEQKTMQALSGMWEEAEFVISDAETESAGRYFCRYQVNNFWSEASEPLVLIVTGLYPKPFILAKPASTVALGQNVTLSCESQLGTDRSVLYKTSGSNAPQAVLASNYEATFHFSPVAKSHGGTYLCYSFDSDFPFLWSTPSDTLILKISGQNQATDLEPPPNSDPEYEHFSLFNFRLVLVGVALAILGTLVNEACRSRKPVHIKISNFLRPEQPEKYKGLALDGALEDAPKDPYKAINGVNQ